MGILALSRSKLINQPRRRSTWSVAGLVITGVALASSVVPAAATPMTAAAITGGAHLRFLTIDVPRATSTSVFAVNDGGVLTGSYTDATGTYHGFIEAGSQIVRFDPPGSTGTFPSGINDFDTTVGTYSDSNGFTHGFVRSVKGLFTEVNDPLAVTRKKGEGTQVETISNQGVLFGYYSDSHDAWHGFMDRAGVFTTVDDPHAGSSKGDGTFINGVNDGGVLVGTCVASHGSRGFVDSAGTFTTFNFPGAEGTFGSGISQRGVIVGYYLNSKGLHGFMLRAWRFSTLNDPHAEEGTLPIAINQRGDVVVGSYYAKNYVSHGFLVFIGA
jgi:hypothetical protein